MVHIDRKDIARTSLALLMLAGTACGSTNAPRSSENRYPNHLPTPAPGMTVRALSITDLRARYPECDTSNVAPFIEKISRGEVPPRPYTQVMDSKNNPHPDANNRNAIDQLRDSRKDAFKGAVRDILDKNLTLGGKVSELRRFLTYMQAQVLNYLQIRSNSSSSPIAYDQEMVNFLQCDTVSLNTLPLIDQPGSLPGKFNP